MIQRLLIVPAFAASLALLAAPPPAHADHRHRDPGVYVRIDHGGGFAFGWRGHRYVNHAREYRRVERELLEKRARLKHRTAGALADDEFARAQELLARLVRVDGKLEKHRESHADCRH